jgi:cellulose synthase/poly-beta-1,6-N-acetylglucosamine synthase-like glycosyltransferase
MNFSIIITSYKEPKSIPHAISAILEPNLGFFAKNFNKAELIVTAPDDETLNAAKDQASKYHINEGSFIIIKDKGIGKPAALNLAVKQAKGKILFLTDGDMYISDSAISEILPFFNDEEVGGVSGHPASLDDRTTMFGYYSHLFCEAANQQRLKNPNITPMSGYLYAIRNLPELFPIPEEIRAEDAYLSTKIRSLGYKTKYAPEAMAYVHFPKNINDWVSQKKRSLGGNIQLKRFTAQLPQINRIGSTLKQRSIREDLKMALFPIKYAKSVKELLYSIALYPIRLYLWLLIYYNHKANKYKSGMWQRIETSKY